MSLFLFGALFIDAAVEAATSLQELGWSPSSLPLGHCQGDCDSDNDCASGMLCSHDSVPSGCSGTASSPFYDFCYDPNYDGSAYFVAGPTAMSFANARAYCSNLGMPLASIHSDSEQALANAACLDVTPDFCWLGGHSIGNAVHDYEWVDGTAWDYTYWAPGEPNQADGSAEDCVHLYSTWASGAWNDDICTDLFHPLCRGGGEASVGVLEELGWWPSSLPLGNCQGDCDSDNDCSSGLICYHDAVPHGCVGTPSSPYYDYCGAPSAAASSLYALDTVEDPVPSASATDSRPFKEYLPLVIGATVGVAVIAVIVVFVAVRAKKKNGGIVAEHVAEASTASVVDAVTEQSTTAKDVSLEMEAGPVTGAQNL